MASTSKEQVIKFGSGAEFVINEDPELKSTWAQRGTVAGASTLLALLAAHGWVAGDNVVTAAASVFAGIVFAGVLHLDCARHTIRPRVLLLNALQLRVCCVSIQYQAMLPNLTASGRSTTPTLSNTYRSLRGGARAQGQSSVRPDICLSTWDTTSLPGRRTMCCACPRWQSV